MLDAALKHLPLVAILRGVKPEEVEAIAEALYTEGFRVIEVPLNSPNALDSIGRLARGMPSDAVVGAMSGVAPSSNLWRSANGNRTRSPAPTS